MIDMNSRRDFLKKAATGTAAVTIGGVLPGFSAHSGQLAAGELEAQSSDEDDSIYPADVLAAQIALE